VVNLVIHSHRVASFSACLRGGGLEGLQERPDGQVEGPIIPRPLSLQHVHPTMEYDILTLQRADIGGRCVSLQLGLLLLNLFLEGLEVEEALGALGFQLLESEL
jgi:hypothetical protein